MLCRVSCLITLYVTLKNEERNREGEREEQTETISPKWLFPVLSQPSHKAAAGRALATTQTSGRILSVFSCPRTLRGKRESGPVCSRPVEMEMVAWVLPELSHPDP